MLALKSWSQKEYEVIGPSMYNSNPFTIFQNLFYNFFKLISNVIFFPRSSVFEAHFQESSTLQEVKIAMGILAQNLE